MGLEGETVLGPIFEFEDERDLLSEATSVSPHRTQIDVALECREPDGSRVLVAIEVKLSERDFSHCPAFQSKHNDRRDVCAQDGDFGGEPNLCFLLRNYGRGERRLYDLQVTPTNAASVGCAFRRSLSQPMRSVALLKAMIDAGRIDKGVYALTAPLANETIWRRWAEVKTAFSREGSVRLVDLPAPMVLEHLASVPATTLRTRYRL